MSIRLAMPRTLTAKTKPLTLEEISSVAPAVFCKERGPTTLAGYQHIDTESVLRELMKQDYVITSVGQERASKYAWKDQFGKHIVRMRRSDHFDTPPNLDSVVPEVIVVNAHNTSSKLHLLAGLWRFICLNGLMAGATVSGSSFQHNHGSVVELVGQVVEKMATETLPAMQNQVRAMKKAHLSLEDQRIFAARAIVARWGDDAAPTVDDVLAPHRNEDKGDSAWKVYNRIQENVLQGGFTAARTNRRVAQLTNVTSVVQVNRQLWDLAAGYAKAA